MARPILTEFPDWNQVVREIEDLTAERYQSEIRRLARAVVLLVDMRRSESSMFGDLQKRIKKLEKEGGEK